MSLTDVPFILANDFKDEADCFVVGYAMDLDRRALIAPASLWHLPLSRVFQTNKLTTRVPWPMSQPRWSDYTGDLKRFQEGATFWMEYGRQQKVIGMHERAENLRQGDFGGFMYAPAEIDESGQKLEEIVAAQLWNDADTMLDYTGTFYFAESGKPNNPAVPGMGTYGNLTYSLPLLPANISEQIGKLRSRRGSDGLPLMPMLDAPRYNLFVSPDMAEEAENYSERIDWRIVGGNGETNVVKGRINVMPVPLLDDDLWIIGVDHPSPMMKPLVRMPGGSPTDAGAINQKIDAALGGTGASRNDLPQYVAEVETFVWTTADEYYKDTGRVAIAQLRTFGVGLGNSILLEAARTSAAPP